MEKTSYQVIVVGGGISGLTAAWHLKQAGVDVALIERESTVGDCTRTESRDGFLLEKGPFNVMVRDPAFEALLEGVSDRVSVVRASHAARKRFIYRRGKLHAVPTNPVALATTGLLSVGSRLRLMSGMLLSRRAGSGEETIEQVATRRFGREVADTMVSAVISGIFAGDIKKLSLEACFPVVGRIDREARSLIGYGLASAFKKKKGKHRRRWRGLVSLDGGLGALTGALGEALGSDLRTSCTVDDLRSTDEGYEVDIIRDDGCSERLTCQRLVMAAPVAEAERLLSPQIPEIADVTQTISSASLVVLNLGFRRSEIGHPLDGFGFLVPQNEPDFPLMGVLWADSIFPHHAPADHRLIRVFIGGARDASAVDRSDDELLNTAIGSLRDLLQISGSPMLVDVCRYPAAIPQYYAGHAERIKRLRQAVATAPHLHVIGNYLEGVSLNDCVRLATETAEKISQSLDAPNEMQGTESPPAAAVAC